MRGDWIETQPCKSSSARRAAARGYRRFVRAGYSAEQRPGGSDDGSGLSWRRLLPRQQRQGLQARSERERQGLRRPRQRERQRGPLSGVHDDDHHAGDYHDDAEHDHDDLDYVDDEHNDLNDTDHVDDDHHARDHHDDPEHDHHVDADVVWIRNASERRGRRRRNTSHKGGASEGAGKAGQGRARSHGIRAEQPEGAAVHGLPGLASGSDRLSDAGRRIDVAESRVLRVALERRTDQAVETDLRRAFGHRGVGYPARTRGEVAEWLKAAPC